MADLEVDFDGEKCNKEKGKSNGDWEEEELGSEMVTEVEVSLTKSTVAEKEEGGFVLLVLAVYDEVEEELGQDKMAMVQKDEVLMEDDMGGKRRELIKEENSR